MKKKSNLDEIRRIEAKLEAQFNRELAEKIKKEEKPPEKVLPKRKKWKCRDLLQPQGTVTPKKFAEEVNVSEQTVRRWVNQKFIKGKRVGKRKLYIPVSEVKRILEEK